jgi:parvulin-like peptidyl-prolyl isomerase
MIYPTAGASLIRSCLTSLLGMAVVVTHFAVTHCAAADVSPGRVIVRVNQSEIKEGDLAFLYLARRVKDEMKASVRDRYLEDLIDQTLLKEFLASRRIKAADTVVDEQVDRLEKLIQREGLEFEEVLKSLGYTRESFREEVALPVAWRGYSRLQITDTAIEDYWNSHRSEFDGTEVKASQIVRKLSADAPESEVGASSKALAEVRAQIEKGELTFADAAKKHSDSPSAKDGGRLGQFPLRGRMPIVITRKAFGLKPGEVSQPFQTPFGIHIVMVDEIIPGDLTLEDARREIFNTLSDQLRASLIEERRSKAKIVWTEPRQQ